MNKKIIDFLIIYLTINFVLFILSGFFGNSLKIFYSGAFNSLVSQIVLLGVVYWVVKKDRIKTGKLLISILFYILGLIIFLFTSAGSVQYISPLLFFAYFLSVTLVVWKLKRKIFYLIPIFILLLQVGTTFIPSKKCVGRMKGATMYSCDCTGLIKSNFLAGENCIGKRTNCYIHRPTKQEVDCSELDNYEYNPGEYVNP